MKDNQPIGEGNFEEVKFSMPWGHVAGKWWGDKKSPLTILALHDWQQNASAFDKLIPKLTVPSVIAIDLPGHGQSSHVGKSPAVHPHDLLLVLRRIVEKVSKKCRLMGHGYGSVLALIYAALYEFQTDTVISIESSFNVITHLWKEFPKGYQEATDTYLKLEKTPAKCGTIDELSQTLKQILNNRITNESAKHLLSREIREVGNNRYQLISDPKNIVQPLSKFNDAHSSQLTGRIQSKCLSIWNTKDNEDFECVTESKSSALLAKGKYELISRKGPKNVYEDHKKTLESLKSSARYLEEHNIWSEYHLLLDEKHPIVAQIINNFFNLDIPQMKNHN